MEHKTYKIDLGSNVTDEVQRHIKILNQYFSQPPQPTLDEAIVRGYWNDVNAWVYLRLDNLAHLIWEEALNRPLVRAIFLVAGGTEQVEEVLRGPSYRFWTLPFPTAKPTT